MKEDIVTAIKMRLDHILKENQPFDREDGGIRIYKDYRDEIPDSTIAKWIQSDHPLDAMYEELGDWAIDYEFYTDSEYIEEQLLRHFSKAERDLFENYAEYREVLNDWINENVYYYYDIDEWNKDVCVDIILDTGNLNYDFTCDNPFYYAGMYKNVDIQFSENSSLLWLSKQLGFEKEFKTMLENLKKEYEDEGYSANKIFEITPQFVKECWNEMVDLGSLMGTVFITVKMPMLDYLKLVDEFKNDKDNRKSYQYEDRTSTKYINVSKNAVVGLFDQFGGCGGQHEIHLDKDITIPFNAVYDFALDSDELRYLQLTNGNTDYSIHRTYEPIEKYWWIEDCVSEVYDLNDMSIKVAVEKYRMNYLKLEDDEKEYGGISFIGETVGDILDEFCDEEIETIGQLNNVLKRCGIKTIDMKDLLKCIEVKNIYKNYSEKNTGDASKEETKNKEER